MPRSRPSSDATSRVGLANSGAVLPAMAKPSNYKPEPKRIRHNSPSMRGLERFTKPSR